MRTVLALAAGAALAGALAAVAVLVIAGTPRTAPHAARTAVPAGVRLLPAHVLMPTVAATRKR